jgi:hypothetical protein
MEPSPGGGRGVGRESAYKSHPLGQFQMELLSEAGTSRSRGRVRRWTDPPGQHNGLGYHFPIEALEFHLLLVAGVATGVHRCRASPCT